MRLGPSARPDGRSKLLQAILWTARSAGPAGPRPRDGIAQNRLERFWTARSAGPAGPRPRDGTAQNRLARFWTARSAGPAGPRPRDGPRNRIQPWSHVAIAYSAVAPPVGLAGASAFPL